MSVAPERDATPPSVTAPFDDATIERLAAALRPVGLDFEIQFFEAVRRREPDHAPALEALGHAYTQRGRVREGLEVDRRLAELRPHDAIVHYNLACSYALVGDVDRGIASLARAVELGYDDVEHLRNDRDLDRLRGHERFEELVRKLAS